MCGSKCAWCKCSIPTSECGWHCPHSSCVLSEYDIKEKYSPESGAVYDDMIRVLRENLGQNTQTVQVRKVTMLPMDEKVVIAQMLKRHTTATPRQLEKFLNMEVRK